MPEPVGTEQLYFDPFAENGEALFDPLESFSKIEARYTAGDIEHDYSADNFVRDTEALMMDAAFMERFDELVEIAAQMHELCDQDQSGELAFAAEQSDVLSAVRESMFGGETGGADGDDDEKKKQSRSKLSLPKLAYIIPPNPN